MIVLRHTLFHKIEVHAMQTYPEECCGVLLGVNDGGKTTVCDIVLVENAIADNRERRFLISPDDYRQIELQAESEGIELVGLYHSHPDHPARPSAFDLDHALPSWSYIIVSVAKGIATDVRSWRLKEDRAGFVEEEMEIVDAPFLPPCVQIDMSHERSQKT